MKARLLAFAVAAGVITADQLTKWWVVATRPYPDFDGLTLIPGFLYIRHVKNSGAAFGLLPGAGSFIALGAIAAAVLIVLVVHRLEGRMEAVAMGLVLGGAVGNLLDRFFRGPGLLDGRVVDFVDFEHFPAFNVADSAITVGAGLAILAAFVLTRKEQGDARDQG